MEDGLLRVQVLTSLNPRVFQVRTRNKTVLPDQVTTLNRLGPGCPRFDYLDVGIFSSKQCPGRLLDPPSLLPMCTRALSWGLEQSATSFHLVYRLRLSGAMSPFPHISSRLAADWSTRSNFTVLSSRYTVTHIHYWQTCIKYLGYFVFGSYIFLHFVTNEDPLHYLVGLLQNRSQYLLTLSAELFLKT